VRGTNLRFDWNKMKLKELALVDQAGVLNAFEVSIPLHSPQILE
jgi:hypothetical protein